MKKLISSIALLFLCSTALAEYRVYQYYVKSKNTLVQDQQAYLVTSSLDPSSYVAYHGGEDSIEVDLVNTWICKGDTSNREFCNSPYTELASLEGALIEDE